MEHNPCTVEGEFTFDIPTFNAATAMEFLADRSAARRLYGQLVDGKTATPVPSATLPPRVCRCVALVAGNSLITTMLVLALLDIYQPLFIGWY